MDHTHAAGPDPSEGAAPQAAPDSFEADFQRHFDTAYGGRGKRFADYAHAYQFGRKEANAPRSIGRSYAGSEEDLRAIYELRYPDRSFEDVKAAVRYGFERGKAIASTDTPDALHQGGGPLVEEDRTQIESPAAVKPPGETARKADSMTEGPPPRQNDMITKDHTARRD